MLRAYRREDCRLVPTELDLTSHSTPADAAGALWLDLITPTREEVHFAEHLLGISIPTQEEAQEIEVSARLHHEDGAEFMTMTGVWQLESDAPMTTPISFILKGDTARAATSDEVNGLRRGATARRSDALIQPPRLATICSTDNHHRQPLTPLPYCAFEDACFLFTVHRAGQGRLAGWTKPTWASRRAKGPNAIDIHVGPRALHAPYDARHEPLETCCRPEAQIPACAEV